MYAVAHRTGIGRAGPRHVKWPERERPHLAMLSAVRKGPDMQELHARAQDALAYTEMLRVPSMSVGWYHLPAGSADPQQPHTEDEIYVVLSGRGRLHTDTGDADAVPGAVLYVPAGERHRFIDIVHDLDVVVLFAPAEHSLAGRA
jgi:mannose-6-phosphate isomerase-like protein (cupin superfamily)